MGNRFARFMLLFALVAAGTPAAASDLAKEQRWAEQIVDALLDGEAVYLDDGRSRFLAIETESAAAGSKAVVVMHGTGVHPDWPTVVLPLRVGLAEHGWHTLSIQMPVLENEAPHEAYAAIYDWVPGRIDAAVRHLREQGFETVVLVAHSQGATMTAYYLAGTPEPVEGFVAVGMSGGIPGGPMDTLGHLGNIEVATLDLYGGQDLAEVLASAPARAAEATRRGTDYEQRRVAGADHFFEGEESALMAAVTAWLDARFD
jgi:pimeloyl-ACP methyl ester carboxylesterase